MEDAVDVVIIGAGAAGLMCAIEAGRRGRSVTVLEHNASVGEKIRISGGGRCNFTNTAAGPANYLSRNPRFCISALSRFTPADLIARVTKHSIDYYEKKLGQLFCTGSARQIIDMLLADCRNAGVSIRTSVDVAAVASPGGENDPGRFVIETSAGRFSAVSLVVASGGLSLPKLGATPLGYRLAEQFGLRIVTPRPGLVPFLWRPEEARYFLGLSGISVDVAIHCREAEFRESLLFTHRGLSGPAILQVSSYWEPGDAVVIDLLPGTDAGQFLRDLHPTRKELATVLERRLPVRFVRAWLEMYGGSRPMAAYSSDELARLARGLSCWQFVPAGTEGFGKAEVTVGGVDTDDLSSKTMEAKKVPGLYFIGEVMDVTGWLGGYNFQWAWASGWAAGQYA